MVVMASGGQCKAEVMQEETSGVGSTLQLLWPYMLWNSTWARKTWRAVLLGTGRRTDGSEMSGMLAISSNPRSRNTKGMVLTKPKKHQKLSKTELAISQKDA